MIVLSGCSKDINLAKPKTIEQWMKVPANQRLANPEYTKLLVENLRNDPVLYRAIKAEIQSYKYDKIRKR